MNNEILEKMRITDEYYGRKYRPTCENKSKMCFRMRSIAGAGWIPTCYCNMYEGLQSRVNVKEAKII